MYITYVQYVCTLNKYMQSATPRQQCAVRGQHNLSTRLHEVRAVTCGLQGYASEALQDAEVAQRKLSETWLVLEYCSKGSLQDALDRSVCASISNVPFVLQHVAAVDPLLLMNVPYGGAARMCLQLCCLSPGRRSVRS